MYLRVINWEKTYLNIAVNSVPINTPSLRECESIYERKIFATRERSLFL